MSRCRNCQPVPQQLRQVAELLERRWLLSILFAALSGAIRFNEFASAVEGISARMLAERLRDLEQAGLVRRRVLPSSPPTVEYRLTEQGRLMRPVIEALQAYAAISMAAPSAPPRSPSAVT